MPIIKDLKGNALNVKIKYTVICDLNFIITKRYPDGTKSPTFYAGYEAITGHWVASDKKKDGVISDIEKHIHIIKQGLKERENVSPGGLFG